MIRLGLVTPGLSDATSWYRAAGPLEHLMRYEMRDELIVVPVSQPPQWCSFMHVDLLLIQRPTGNEAMGWLRAARAHRIPVWLDYDDDVLNIPTEHLHYAQFAKGRENIRELLESAALITVSTDAIRQSFRSFVPSANIVVVPNALDERLADWQPRKEFTLDLLAWRGGFSHTFDLEFGRDILSRHNVHYFGILPRWAAEGDNVCADWQWDIVEYQKSLNESKAAVLLCPLEDTLFNRARSNCVWLEATLAGMVVVHWSKDRTKLPEFMRPGIMGLEQGKIITNESFKQHYQTSRAYIESNLLLKSVNKLRAEALRSVL